MQSQFLPWYNYPLTDFIMGYIKEGMHVFEFGCGFSTLFYAQNGCNVIAVETRESWKAKVQELASEYGISEKITIHLEKPHKIHEVLSMQHCIFDLVIIDSYNRITCLQEAKKLPHKMIVLDNSERQNLQSATQVMKDYKTLKFQGEGINRQGQSKATVFTAF